MNHTAPPGEEVRFPTTAIIGYPFTPLYPTAQRCPLPSTLKDVAFDFTEVKRTPFPERCANQPVSKLLLVFVIWRLKGVEVSPQVVSRVWVWVGVLVAVLVLK